MIQDNDTDWQRIQTFSNEPVYVEAKWELQEVRNSTDDIVHNYYKEDFGMQGHSVTNVALTWQPWLEIGQCTEGDKSIREDNFKNCESAGVLNTIMDNLGSLYNFTWTLDMPASGLWGSAPIIPDNSSDTIVTVSNFYGALGSTMRKEYDIALSVWAPFPERINLADFTMAVVNMPKGMIINKENIPLDFTFFVRPFTFDSWLAIIGCLVVLAPVIVYFHWSEWISEENLSRRVAVLCGWTLFVLLSAFYGGALTMFFSSAIPFPFTELREGLRNGWEMVIQSGYQATPLRLAKAGEEEFVDWARRQQESGDLVVDTFEEVMSSLREKYVFTFAEIPQFVSEFNSRPGWEGVTPQQVGKTYSASAHLILWKNSPLLPMMNRGLNRMLQAGNLDVALKQLSLKMPEQENLGTRALNGGDMVMVFAAFSLLLVATFVLLLVEIFVGFVWVPTKFMFHHVTTKYLARYNGSWKKAN